MKVWTSELGAKDNDLTVIAMDNLKENQEIYNNVVAICKKTGNPPENVGLSKFNLHSRLLDSTVICI